jgi:hypothetical protein
MRRRPRTRDRHPSNRQLLLPFQLRAERLARSFKATIAGITVVIIAALLAGTSAGRDAAASLATGAPAWIKARIGFPPLRTDIQAANELKRTQQVGQAAAGLVDLYNTTTPGLRRLLELVGMIPGDCVLRWGNLDQILLLSSRVFEPDEHGRSYRLRPNARSIWLSHITPRKGPFTLLLVPDTPEVRRAAEAAGGFVVEQSAQTTNSWGCRGHEPDPNAALRVLVLGDSFMQGTFIGDGETPPDRLEDYLRAECKSTVSVLNSGHLGYSPEQYYYTLREYAGRFRPHFVVVAVFANDMGDQYEVMEYGRGDWSEAGYWLGEIEQLCRTRGMQYLVATIPAEIQLKQGRKDGFYPGLVANAAQPGPFSFYNPMDEFINEHLRLRAARVTLGGSTDASALYNSHLGDRHFSALGAELWARVIGRRLVLLKNYLRAIGI